MVDWAALLTDLTALGYSMSALQRETGVSRTSLLHYLDEDTTPLHHHGERIITYWMQATRQTRAQLPLKPKPISAAKA